MSNGARGGRPRVTYVQDALDIIAASDVPVSTHELIRKLGLKENEAVYLRRGLKYARDKGEIRRIVRSPDGSFTWVPTRCSLETCAAHAANLFLRREKANVQVDPEQFERLMKGKAIIQQ